MTLIDRLMFLRQVMDFTDEQLQEEVARLEAGDDDDKDFRLKALRVEQADRKVVAS